MQNDTVSRQPAERRLTIGISDHVAGPDLPGLIARANAFDPALLLDVRIDFSHALLEKFDRAELDAVVVRREGNRRGGEKLLEDEFGWFAAPNFHHSPGEKLRLAMLAAPCGVRAHAIRALDKANVKWLEAFTGGGVTAVAAAISCGLAVAPRSPAALRRPARSTSGAPSLCRLSAARQSRCIRAFRTRAPAPRCGLWPPRSAAWQRCER